MREYVYQVRVRYAEQTKWESFITEIMQYFEMGRVEMV